MLLLWIIEDLKRTMHLTMTKRSRSLNLYIYTDCLCWQLKGCCITVYKSLPKLFPDMDDPICNPCSHLNLPWLCVSNTILIERDIDIFQGLTCFPLLSVSNSPDSWPKVVQLSAVVRLSRVQRDTYYHVFCAEWLVSSSVKEIWKGLQALWYESQQYVLISLDSWIVLKVYVYMKNWKN